MKTLTVNEAYLILCILKSPEKEYNAHTLAKEIGITPMGALKIARRLEKENILRSKKLGKAVFYWLNLDNSYVQQYVIFLLNKEAEQAPPYVKRWVTELKKIKNADIAILFGSVLKKHEKARDIDILLVTDKKRFSNLKKEIKEINSLNIKKLHPLYQTQEDIEKNIKKEDIVILNALKGIVVFGEKTILNLCKK